MHLGVVEEAVSWYRARWYLILMVRPLTPPVKIYWKRRRIRRKPEHNKSNLGAAGRWGGYLRPKSDFAARFLSPQPSYCVISGTLSDTAFDIANKGYGLFGSSVPFNTFVHFFV
ncbi:hypothetical protein J6590_027616 [Homalodisca vitripennis]|nr:hypothetical protein J6590_027616 [Homalodisca vitripennis]